MNYERFRESLKARRRQLGLAQWELGERMGVNQSVVSDLETGKVRSPQWGTIEKWGKALKLDVQLITIPYYCQDNYDSE